jgi:hypothetical protein
MATSKGGRWSDLGLETDSGDRDVRRDSISLATGSNGRN